MRTGGPALSPRHQEPEMATTAEADSRSGSAVKELQPRNIDTSSDPRSIKLQDLLHQNHSHYSVLYNNFRFHNHSPHLLASAYLAGASTESLDEIYNGIVTRGNLEPWHSSPSKITIANHRDYIAKRDHQRSWDDFFTTVLQGSPSWQTTAIDFLLNTVPSAPLPPIPLIYSLVADLGHPLIHLGYAFELNSLTLAIEALTLIATCYDCQLATLLTTACLPPTITQKPPTPSLQTLFYTIQSDPNLPTFPSPGDDNMPLLLSHPEHLSFILAHFNSFTFSPSAISSNLHDIHRISTQILLSTTPTTVPNPPSSAKGFDFFLAHLLTTSHALHTLISHFPTSSHDILLRQWLFMAMVAYLSQNRPLVSDDDSNRDGPKSSDSSRTWQDVSEMMQQSKFKTDAHFVKVLSVLQHASTTWEVDTNLNHNDHSNDINGDLNQSSVNSNPNTDVGMAGGQDGFFLNAALRFIDSFDGWCGFDEGASDAAIVRQNRINDGILVR